MSDPLHPGRHPGADVLSAFLEGALPEHERAECLTHLAECAQCREIAFLAREAAETEVPAAAREAAVPVRRTMFRPVFVVAAIAVAIVSVFSVGIYRMIRSAEPRIQVTAKAKAPVKTAPSAAPERLAPATSQATGAPVERRNTVRGTPVGPAEGRGSNQTRLASRVPQAEPEAVARVAPLPAPSQAAALFGPAPAPVAAPAVPPPAPAPKAVAAAQLAAVPTTAGVTGFIMDPAGAVIPRAQVELKNDATGATFSAASDARGQFSIAGLAPGRYDLSVTSMGFKKFVQPSIQVEPQVIARVDSRLEVGAAADTVTVTTEAPLLKTESGEVSHQVEYTSADSLPLLNSLRALPPPVPEYILPDTSKPVNSAVKGKTVLAADVAGVLFRSEDGGKSWKRVKGKWKGRVVRVVLTPNATFELTTDPASTWVSADGRKWAAAPASR